MADDALRCFQSLLDTIPTWQAELQDILKSAEERQQEISSSGGEMPEYVERAPSKSSSMHSTRSADGPEYVWRTVELMRRPAPRQWNTPDTLRLSQRKRKLSSVVSAASGPSKIRTKPAAVIYYDGDTQKHFEKLVRAIGGSRNTIRKGKMSAKVDSLSRSDSSCSDGSSSNSEGEVDLPMTKMGRMHSPRPSGFSAFNRLNDTEVFDKVDGRLEKAQALCEKAAHQVLRDGDCTQEVSQAQSHFTEALRLAKEEIPNLEKKAEKSAARRRRSEERRRVEEEVEKQKKANDAALQRILSVAAAAGNVTPPPAVTAPLSSPSPFVNEEVRIEVDDLEVDSNDEDSDGEDFTIANLPSFGKFSAMRNARLAAPVA